jgi:hypothetical protein
MQSNTVQRNYIFPPSEMRYALEAEVAQYKEEKMIMEQRVKELELRLAHQMERYDNIKEDLRGVKKGGSNGDKQIMVGNCVIL